MEKKVIIKELHKPVREMEIDVKDGLFMEDVMAPLMERPKDVSFISLNRLNTMYLVVNGMSGIDLEDNFLYVENDGVQKDGLLPQVKPARTEPLKVGEKVKVKSNGLVGEVTRVSGKNVTISVGNISSTRKAEGLERISSSEFREVSRKVFKPVMQKVDASITNRKLSFRPELDIRGERLTDALDIVTHYIDDAIMLGVGQVRIIHGKGTGVLHEEIQKYLRTVPGVSRVSDEDVRIGGAGVTIVTLE